jgi:hypothetical protein
LFHPFQIYNKIFGNNLLEFDEKILIIEDSSGGAEYHYRNHGSITSIEEKVELNARNCSSNKCVNNGDHRDISGINNEGAFRGMNECNKVVEKKTKGKEEKEKIIDYGKAESPPLVKYRELIPLTRLSFLILLDSFIHAMVKKQEKLKHLNSISSLNESIDLKESEKEGGEGVEDEELSALAAAKGCSITTKQELFLKRYKILLYTSISTTLLFIVFKSYCE